MLPGVPIIVEGTVYGEDLFILYITVQTAIHDLVLRYWASETKVNGFQADKIKV